MQAPPAVHCRVALVHGYVQTLVEQVGTVLAGAPGLQSVPQAPQFWDVVSGVSQPAVALEQSPKPPLHVCKHAPVAQLAVAFSALLHAMLQPAQFVPVLVFVSHPRLPLPEQWANPPAHEVAGIEHTPLTH
jgi:hypothetical protein